MTATDHPGGFWRRKGYRSRVTCIYEQASRQTRKKQQEKRKNKQIRRCLQSGQKPQREETNIKIVKKTAKEKQAAEQATLHATTITKPGHKQTAGQNSRKPCETGICRHQKTCNNKQCKIRNTQMGQKKQEKQTNNPTKKRKQEFIYNPLSQVEQASKTSKQPWYTATATCAFFSSKKCTKY